MAATAELLPRAAEQPRLDRPSEADHAQLAVPGQLRLRLQAPSADRLAAAAPPKVSKLEAASDGSSVSPEEVIGAYFTKGDTAQALDVVQRLLAAYRDAGDRRAEAATMVLVTEAYASRENQDEVLRWAHDAAALFHDLGDVRNEAVARYTIAKAHLERDGDGDKEQGKHAAAEARELFRRLGDFEKDLMLASVLHSVAFLLRDPDEALRSAQELVKEREAAGIPRATAAALHELARVRLTRAEPREARKAAHEARAVYQSLGCWSGEATALSCVAHSFFMQGRADEGLEAASDMLRIYRRAGERESEAVLLLEVAELQLDRRMPSRALRAAEPALIAFRGLGDAAATRRCMEVIHDAQHMRDHMKEAVKAAKEAMAHYEQLGNTEGLHVSARLLYDARAAFAQAPAVARVAGMSGDRGSSADLPVHQPWGCDWAPGGRSRCPRGALRKADGRYSISEAGILLRRAAAHAMPTPPQESRRADMEAA